MNEYTTECLEETKSECLGSLDEIARGARCMLALALQAEVEEYVQQAKQARDDQGHALVVRNGQAQEVSIPTQSSDWVGIGAGSWLWQVL